MGLGIFSRAACQNNAQGQIPNLVKPKTHKVVSRNPNPLHFEILQLKKIGRFVIVMIRYPDCSNYEGKKILVFENVRINTIKSLKYIDPHFCNCVKHPSPVARFKPDQSGFRYAVDFCQYAVRKGE